MDAIKWCCLFFCQDNTQEVIIFILIDRLGSLERFVVIFFLVSVLCIMWNLEVANVILYEDSSTTKTKYMCAVIYLEVFICKDFNK